MLGLLKRKPNGDSKEIEESGLFSGEWYVSQYPDAAKFRGGAAAHYLEQGAALGYDPGPDFSTLGYLARYPDVARAAINPLLHYLRHGKLEGRVAVTPQDLEKSNRNRPYRNFAEFLRHCLLNPLINAPFEEMDRCCFAVMDKLAADLAARAAQAPETGAPLVSVIMPAYNRESVIGEAIESVLSQSYHRFELIVVDDGSTDGTVKAASRYATDPRVRVERSGHLGVSGARNRALALATGDLIAYLDSDNSWRPDYLASMVGAFLQLPEIEAAYSGQYVYQAGDPEPGLVRFGSYNKSMLRNNNYIDLNCFMHRSSALLKAGGGFCETLMRLEDWDLILRISNSCRMVSVPVLQSNYFHDRTDNTISRNEPLSPALRIVATRTSLFRPETTPPLMIRQLAVVLVSNGSPDQLRAAVDGFYAHYTDADVELIIVRNASLEPVRDLLDTVRQRGAQLVLNDKDVGFSHAANQGAALARPEADLVLLRHEAVLEPGAIEFLQEACYASPGIALSVPQYVVPAAHPDTWRHTPYAQEALPCDITLSLHHRNVEQLGVFHDGEWVELNFATFNCAYIKREVWNRCGGLEVAEPNPHRIMCDYVRNVLSLKIIYSPAAIVRDVMSV